MPGHDTLRPSQPTTCTVCGKPLGGGPWWMLDPGRGTHEACADWQRRPFPMSREIDRLRRLRTRLVRAMEAVDATIEMLERARARWPRDSRRALARGRAWTERLEVRLRDLGVLPAAGAARR